MNIQRFLTYSEISNNEVHKGVSIDIGDLTLEEIQKAIENAKSFKEKNINDINTKPQIVEIKCSKCGCKENTVRAFCRCDFIYRCTECDTDYNVHFERVPVEIKEVEPKGYEPVDLSSEENKEKFLKEYNCKWLEDDTKKGNRFIKGWNKLSLKQK